ncbi:MAG: histidine phosphatase family protein [bacterium]
MSKTTARIYLVRHGSTAWNEIVRFRGVTDIPLSEKGRNQALALGRWFAGIPLSAIFSSPLIRAQETARAIAEQRHLPIMLRDGLRSVNYGSWEGQSEAEVEQQDPEAFQLYLEGIECFRFPQGETLDDLRKRAVLVLEEAIRNYPGERIVLVRWRREFSSAPFSA